MRLVEILKQPQFKPLSLEKQVTLLFAGAKGFLDKYPIDVLAKYVNILLMYWQNMRQDFTVL